MTRLLDDLTAIAARHGNQHPDEMVLVPIGAVRAARTMIERYEGWPLIDRALHPAFIDHATTPKRGGRKNASLCGAQTLRRQREREHA